MLQRVKDIAEIINYAGNGEMPPRGDISQADALVAFSFGVHLNANRNLPSHGLVTPKLGLDESVRLSATAR